MKLIKHIIFVNIDDDEKLMINSLYGLVDKIDNATFELIKKWQGQEVIAPNDEIEFALYNNLKSRNYLVNNFDEESSKKEMIIVALRKNHASARANNHHITFVMTYDCNFACPYCFEGNANRIDNGQNLKSTSCSKTEVMTPELIDAAFNLVGDNLQSIGLFGGEPLLPKTRSAFEYIVSKAPDKTYNITSNGYYLTEFLDLLTRIKISYIIVTLDGEEETHDSRRHLADGGPTYNKIMDGIEKCLENKIPIHIRMNIDEGNLDECMRLKLKLIEQFSRHGDLLSFESSPMMESSDQETLNILSEMYNAEIEYTPEERKQRNHTLSELGPLVSAIATNSKIKPAYSYCFAHESGLAVDPFGSLYPCLRTVGIEEFAIGKYHPIVEFKESSIRTRNIDSIPECRECKYSLLCGGGCPVGLPNYSNIFKPVCLVTRNEIHNILPMVYRAEKTKRGAKK